ncbi:unnamed protein product [Cuscuta campestris]|uniref:Knottin scorpion toxin-like domain-containing protein n=1 Tax=Cuscuta campestris TaxID=132261 RepID=A0A484JZZ1_9ASTE|nr:unnamed protein product [Cuscuta campestris]
MKMKMMSTPLCGVLTIIALVAAFGPIANGKEIVRCARGSTTVPCHHQGSNNDCMEPCKSRGGGVCYSFDLEHVSRCCCAT